MQTGLAYKQMLCKHKQGASFSARACYSPWPHAQIEALAAHAGRLLDASRYLLIGGLTYGAAALAVGEQLLPGGKAWAVLLIWFASYVGGEAVKLVKLPPLLGMLLSGIILVNLPGQLVAGLPDSWGASLRAGALAIILTRCASLCYDDGSLPRLLADIALLSTSLTLSHLRAVPMCTFPHSDVNKFQVRVGARYRYAAPHGRGCSKAHGLPRHRRGGRRRGSCRGNFQDAHRSRPHSWVHPCGCFTGSGGIWHV